MIDISTYTGYTYSNTRLYTGREYDRESGLYYLRARYYSPDTGNVWNVYLDGSQRFGSYMYDVYADNKNEIIGAVDRTRRYS